MTHSYTLLVPLMIVSSVAYFFAHLLEPNSVYRKALAESNLLVNDRDQTMLRRLQVKFSINRRYRVLRPGDILTADQLAQLTFCPVRSEINSCSS